MLGLDLWHFNTLARVVWETVNSGKSWAKGGGGIWFLSSPCMPKVTGHRFRVIWSSVSSCRCSVSPHNLWKEGFTNVLPSSHQIRQWNFTTR
jgi:hypothetical protein